MAGAASGTGEEWPVYENLSKDQQESWTIFGIYTGYSWTPDDKQIVIWANGQIMKVDVNGINQATVIPFTCKANHRIYDAVRFRQDINPENFKVNDILLPSGLYRGCTSNACPPRSRLASPPAAGML